MAVFKLTGHFFAIVGESLTILQSELKHQRKLVRSLKKKSLWSRNLEEVYDCESLFFFFYNFWKYKLWFGIFSKQFILMVLLSYVLKDLFQFMNCLCNASLKFHCLKWMLSGFPDMNSSIGLSTSEITCKMWVMKNLISYNCYYLLQDPLECFCWSIINIILFDNILPFADCGEACRCCYLHISRDLGSIWK